MTNLDVLYLFWTTQISNVDCKLPFEMDMFINCVSLIQNGILFVGSYEMFRIIIEIRVFSFALANIGRLTIDHHQIMKLRPVLMIN